MPRKKSPDAKDITMSARFSEAEAAMIDEARGAEDRSVWLRRAALAAVARQRPPAGAADRQAGAAAENRAAARGDCPHPAARVLKGLCGACGTYVGK